MKLNIFLFMLACSSNPTNEAGATPATPAVVLPPVETTTQAVAASTIGGELQDLTANLAKTGCDNGPGGAGAVSYFVGEIRIDGNSVTGEEKWLMYANSKWKATGGQDCFVRWGMNGAKAPVSKCSFCSTGISLINELDRGGSTCPKDMAKTNTGESIKYDLHLRDDGTATVYFAGSGRRLGDGVHKDGVVRYVSDMSCRWF
jgi:hypothetical protein